MIQTEIIAHVSKVRLFQNEKGNLLIINAFYYYKNKNKEYKKEWVNIKKYNATELFAQTLEKADLIRALARPDVSIYQNKKGDTVAEVVYIAHEISILSWKPKKDKELSEYESKGYITKDEDVEPNEEMPF